MFRFTIRDVLWLLLVVPLSSGWAWEFSNSRTRQAKWEADRKALMRDLRVGQLLLQLRDADWRHIGAQQIEVLQLLKVLKVY
jgi:hypothetical protein